ncbi:MAG: hypothetical protein JSV67_04585 [Thermoplasmatales archaeon]|nr:MAG: hypothetical protein JSV67_04585 [Thermoplasmatales archaeon]
MFKKICGIFICTLLILITLSGSLYAYDFSKIIKTSFETNNFTMQYYYETSFENNDDWIHGSFSGPDLWHQSSFDSWSGDYSMACFREENKHYENNMDFNYLISPMFTVEGAEAMIMNFYFRFITEDSDDHWGIVLYDPGTESYHAHIWTAVESWRHLNYDTFGYQTIWIGPMQPYGKYQSFNILDAYENWYDLGFFRDGNGNPIYDFRIGFVFYETDSTGVSNDEAESNDEYWSGLIIDDVTISRAIINDDPETPSIPSGPNSGREGVMYEYSTSAIDPDNHDIRYGWDWNGDGDIDEWTGYMNSGEIVTSEHTWITVGTYNVQVKAEDIYGAQSDFSNPKSVVISENNPPNKPNKPSGKINGKTGEEYTYTSSTTDPEGDNVFYLFDWGNGETSFILGPYESGTECSASNIWFEDGNYQIKVKSIDEYGAESDWSDPLSITMPKNKKILGLEFLQKFIIYSNLFDILNHLLF